MAEKQKPPPKRKPRRKMTKAEQSERFKETARKLGADESGEAFERAFKKIAPPLRARNDLGAKINDRLFRANLIPQYLHHSGGQLVLIKYYLDPKGLSFSRRFERVEVPF
jgi:hypothetical protein